MLLWIYSSMDSPPTPTFTQDTCTLLCLLCVGSKSSISLLSIVFPRAVPAIRKTLVFGKTPPDFSVLFCHAARPTALNVSLSAFSWLPEPHAASSGQCSAGLARLPGGCWGPVEQQWLAAAVAGCWEQEHTRREVLTPAAAREAACGQTELAHCLQVCGATFSQNRASAKLLVVVLFSCLLPSQVWNGN